MKNEPLILVFIGLLIFFVIVLIGLVIGAFFYFKKKLEKTNNPIRANKISQKPQLEVSADPIVEVECFFHENEPSAAVCIICERAICESCDREHDNFHFCSEHLKVYLSNEWSEIQSVKTTPDEPEKGLDIYRFKETLWKGEQVPALIQTHYKINIEQDHIESHVKLFVIKQKEHELVERFNSFSKKERLH